MSSSIRSKVKILPAGALAEMERVAEAEIENLRGQFRAGAKAGLERMRLLLGGDRAARPAGWQAEAHRIAHDLKGQGATFDYDLVTRIAQALCGHLLSEGDMQARDKKALAHCEALRVILDKDIRGPGDEYGARLLQILGVSS